MSANDLAKDLINFFRTARHLWGRCPDCGSLFRLSEAAITSSAEPPRDWLRRLQRDRASLAEKEADVASREDEVAQRSEQLQESERDLREREFHVERNAKRRVREILGSDTEVRAAIKEATKIAVLRSRANLLGKMLERLAPCFRTFAYDPRDMRCISDPYDYVLFDGLTVERRVKKILFIEVKCGSSRLTSTQRSLRDVVDRNLVSAETWTIGNPNIPITKQLAASRREIKKKSDIPKFSLED